MAINAEIGFVGIGNMGWRMEWRPDRESLQRSTRARV
jgi:hypothetical protein